MTSGIRKRRRRDAQPQPWGTELRLTPRDFLLWQKLQRGPLPVGYLYEETRQVCKNYGWLQHRLTDLYHGCCLDRRGHIRNGEGNLLPGHECIPFTYLSRPPQQELTRKADYNQLVYDLNENAIEALEERGLLSPYRLARRSAWWVHDFMSSCVAASIELAAREAGHRYLTLDDIFGHEACPQETRQAPNPLSLPLTLGRHLVPDDLFGIEFPGQPKKFRCFYAVEIDRKTETLRGAATTKKKPPTIREKIEAYQEAIEHRLYSRQWGIRNLRVLIVTNNAGHARSIAEVIAETIKDRDLHKRFNIKSKAEFGTVWKVPGVMRDLYEEPWHQPGGGLFHLNKP
jgi:hypothetical protein